MCQVKLYTTAGRHSPFRWGSKKDSTGRRSVGRALDKRAQRIWVSTEAQGEIGLLKGQAARVGGDGKEDPKLEQAS